MKQLFLAIVFFGLVMQPGQLPMMMDIDRDGTVTVLNPYNGAMSMGHMDKSGIVMMMPMSPGINQPMRPSKIDPDIMLPVSPYEMIYGR
jgi:hypothetical protein